MEKADIVDILEEIAELLELKGENAFKVRAYSAGARALETLEEDLGTVIVEERLGDIKGIGKALVEKITSLHETGRLDYYDKLKASVPETMIEMLEIPGLGPKKIKKVYDELAVDSIDKLAAACQADQVAGLAGFGKKTQEKILAGIANREAYAARHHWAEAYAAAEPILAGLRRLKQVERAEHAGSLRRKMETVGDLDFLVASTEPAPIMDWFTAQPGIVEVTAHGETKSSIRLEGGLQADLRVVPPAQFFYALHHFTGSKNHNIRMRARALERGLSLSEWGLFPEETRASKDDAPKPSERDPDPIDGEADIFAQLELAYIPPELREDRGEIEAAEKDELPKLLEPGDIRGVFHNHTTASDGRATLEEMVWGAQDLGFEYLGIADHSKSSFQASGLNEERLLAQCEAIRALNETKKFKTYVFTGSEVDILSDGLDFPDELMAQLDYVVASVHAGMTNDEAVMTRRLIRALENEHVTMLGHLTGRLLLKREGYPVDVPKVIDAAIANGKIIELNANPWRLDMDWRHWHKAAERGLLTAINPDAHDPAQLAFYINGVYAARKGWLQPQHVLNTRSLKEVKEYLGVG